MNKLSALLVSSVVCLLCLGATPVMAAAPDGAGPWADEVVSTTQGLRKDGTPVLPARSTPTAAVGVAEDNTADGSFYSLGFGGTITLKFDNGISGGVVTVEATNPDYPVERANVELSQNGTTWFSAGTVTQDGQVAQPEGLACAKYVRVTDVSDPNTFGDSTADAYDLDGVRAEGTACTPANRGNNTVNIDISTNCIVAQGNVSNITTTVTNTSTTGGNKLNGNSGSVTVKTGNVKNKTKVTTAGNVNIASGCGCCCDGGDVTVTIGGNAGVSEAKLAKKAKK